MLKDLAYHWSNSYAAIVIQVAFVTLLVFHNGYNGSKLKLLWNMTVQKHSVEENREPMHHGGWCVKEVLGGNGRVVATFALFETENGINDDFS